jgi:tetratricopeptide (TPR) repeat protein
MGGAGETGAFGELVRRHRLAAGLTQEEVAERAGLSARTIANMERGRTARPYRRSVRALADALALAEPERHELERAGRPVPAAAMPDLTPAGRAVGAGRQQPPPPGSGPSHDRGHESASAVPAADPNQGLPPALKYSLPPDTAAFTGREDEVDLVTSAARASRAAVTGGVAILTIGGMPGIGKTTLAVHAAHRLAAGFPDRQLFLDLHGHTPGRDPVTSEAALAGLLTADGLDPRYLPADLEGRAALWRDRVSGQRVLLVLDNAASSAQVMPLLPGSAGCLVLVTSRRHLADLPGVVTPVTLEVLPPQQAQDMFFLLAPRARADPPAVAELARLAGCLPLAISLLGRMFARHPAWTLTDLVAETRARLLTLTAEHVSIAAAFELSWRHLEPGQQEFFSYLGLHPGTSIDAYSAAALAGVDPDDASRLLETLHGEGLLTEVGYRRYGMHDLIRHFAAGHAASAEFRATALDRLLDYYQGAAIQAEAALARRVCCLARSPVPTPFSEVLGLSDRSRALAWARTERANLLACLDYAGRAEHPDRVVALTAGVSELLRRDGPWDLAIALHGSAVRAAARLGDRHGQAHALLSLGVALRLTGDLSGSAEALTEALCLFRAIGDQHGEANALCELGPVRMAAGETQVAADALTQALTTYRALDDRIGQVGTLMYLGSVRRREGDLAAAQSLLSEALDISGEIGDPLGRAQALLYLGGMHRLTGDYAGSSALVAEALGLFRELGDRLGQANALGTLAGVRRLTGDYRDSAELLEQTLAAFRDLGDERNQSNALCELGSVLRLTGDLPRASESLAQALVLFRRLGDRSGQVEAMNATGELRQASHDIPGATQWYLQALDMARAVTSRLEEGRALAGLGRCAAAEGDIAAAANWLRQAHAVFEQSGAAEAAQIAAEIGALAPAKELDLRGGRVRQFQGNVKQGGP